MEQKYRDIDINKDVRMVGDEASEENTDEWSAIGLKHIGEPYSETRVIRLKYRRPITQQYVYENAGFLDPTVNELLKLMNAINNGTEFYDSKGGRVGLARHTNGLLLEAGEWPTTMQDIHTRNPAPRMTEINGVELVAPETDEPPVGAEYFCKGVGGLSCRVWVGSNLDKEILRIGIWLKEEHCKQVIDAMQKVFFGGEV